MEGLLNISPIAADSPFDSSSNSRPDQSEQSFGVREHPKRRTSSSSRDEMNLAEFPLAVLSTRVNSQVKTLEFKDFTKLSSGDVVERKWIITGADKFGLPTSTDDDVVLGLMRMTMDQGFRERKVYFTRYELLKTLRWTTEGRSYNRLIKSLDRLSGVRIRSTNSFYDNSTKSYQTCNFGIIDAYEINNERVNRNGATAEAPKSFFIWSEVLFESFKVGFIKKLDLDLYFSLKSAVSRRLYRYLDKHFYYRSSIEVPLLFLAFEKVGLSRTYKYVSSVRQQIEPAAEELVNVGFLRSFEFNGKGAQATIRFNSNSLVVLKGGEVRRDAKPQSDATGPRQLSDIVRGKLADRGIAELQAKKLVSGKSDLELRMIDEIIGYYDFLVKRQDPKVSKSPTGFLYRAAQMPEKFKVPADFYKSVEKEGSSRPRPELRSFDSLKDAPNDKINRLRKDYSRFVDREVQRILSQMSEQERALIFKKTESKMGCLKNVLSDASYRSAVAGCIRQEVAKKELPRFKDWAGQKGK